MSNKLTCFKCKELKVKSLFYKENNRKRGCSWRCKKCIDEGKLNRKRKKDGLIAIIFSTQKVSSRKRGMNDPDYSAKELYDWAISQDKFHILYEEWKASHYKKELIPSFDRLDDYKPYTFNNLRIITWAENKGKGHLDQINGINTKQCKAVLQYDMEGSFIREYHSIRHASRETGINNGHISRVCKRELSNAKGWLWKYKSDN